MKPISHPPEPTEAAALPQADAVASSALHEAIRRGDGPAVDALIAAHSPALLSRATDERGCPPLVAAIFAGHTEIAGRLVRAGVGIEHPVVAEASYPLHFAAVLGEVDLIAQLAAGGATIDVADHDGDTPLHWAVRARQYAAARTLLRLGADPRREGHFTGLSPLQLASFLGLPDFERLLGSTA